MGPAKSPPYGNIHQVTWT